MLAILTLFHVSKLFVCTAQETFHHTPKSEGERRDHRNNRLYTMGDFHVSGTLLLSECILLNHWFLALMQITLRNKFFMWLTALQDSSINCTNYLLLTIYVWYVTPKRKPPNPVWNVEFKDITTNLLYFIEDSINYFFKTNVNIMFWSSFMIAQLRPNSSKKDEAANERAHKYLYETKTTKVYKCRSKSIVHRYRGKTLSSNVVLSCTTKLNGTDSELSILPIDQDSYQFAVDTGTTFHVCKHRELFIGDIKKAKSIYIKGVGGRVKVHGYGTIKLRVHDDDSNPCDLEITNVLYVPSCPTNLLSPQLWSECSEVPTGTGEMTVGGMTLLFWDKHKHSMLIPHHSQLKLPIFSANKDATYQALSVNTDQHICHTLPQCFNTSIPVQSVDELGNENVHIIPLDDDEDQRYESLDRSGKTIVIDELDKLYQTKLNGTNTNDFLHPNDRVLAGEDSVLTHDLSEDSSVAGSSASYDDGVSDANSILSDGDSANIPTKSIDEAAMEIVHGPTKEQKEWLQYHYALKHLPIAYMKRLAEQGIIPKRLAKIKPPICVACLQGKQHQKPWKGRGKKIPSIRKMHHNFPGAQTSTDQMISPYGGIIPQMKGRLMKAKYYAATLFVDHYTDYTYVHLMRDTTAASTLAAKNAYESLMMSYGNRVTSDAVGSFETLLLRTLATSI